MSVEPERFYGREQDIEEILRRLKSSPGESIALIGGPKIGKTSLLTMLSQLLTAHVDESIPHLFVPVQINLTGEGIESATAFFRVVCEQTLSKLTWVSDFSSLQSGYIPEGKSPARSFERKLTEWHNILWSKGYQLRLILLLDRCEEVVGKPWSLPLYNALRYLLEEPSTRSLLKVVMAGSYGFLSEVRQNGSPLRGILSYYHLGVLDKKAMYNFITKPFEGEVLDKVVDEIASQSGGHPFLLQYLMQNLWIHNSSDISPDVVQDIVDSFLCNRHDFYYILDGISNPCLILYNTLLVAGRPLTIHDIKERTNKVLPDTPLVLETLYYHGVVAKESDAYHVNGEIFRVWLVDHLNSVSKDEPEKEVSYSDTQSVQEEPPLGNLSGNDAPPPTLPPIQLTLRFSPTSKGANITWESDAVGSVKSSFTVPYNQHLPLIVKALDASQHPGHPAIGPQFNEDERKTLGALGLWKQGRVPSEAHQVVGRKLFSALTRSKNGGQALNTVRETARFQGKSISYILRFPREAVELAALPWEAMRDDRQSVLLSRGNREIDSCERYLDLDEALSPPLPAGKKLHILALSPEAGIPVDIRDEERTARLKSWSALKEKGLLDWDELSPVTTVSLDDRMRRGPTPDIIHYYGHGIYRDGQGYLQFDSATTPGQYELVSANRLSAILGGIRLIMMHACQSAMVDVAENQSGLLTGIAPSLSVVSEAVVAMQLTVRISAATRFSEVFYEEIARGRSLQAAVADARRSLYVTEGDGASWYVPTLYIRTREQKPIYLLGSKK
jgi:hypothetical protein